MFINKFLEQLATKKRTGPYWNKYFMFVIIIVIQKWHVSIEEQRLYIFDIIKICPKDLSLIVCDVFI